MGEGFGSGPVEGILNNLGRSFLSLLMAVSLSRKYCLGMSVQGPGICISKESFPDNFKVSSN